MGRCTGMLEIDALSKRYGQVTALDGASFSARRGRLTGFLGPNGSGKTTTMRCVFGLVRPDAGETRWDGRPIDADARLRFGYMPEQRGLYPRMRVREQLSYFAQQHGLSGRLADAASDSWLERFGLADRAKGKLEDLSHGNQQRVQLAAALVHEPELLVLDEPFSGLDPLGMATMTEVLRERAIAGVGVVFSSHQLDLVEDICEDVVIIARGRIVAQGPIGELRAASGRRHLEIEIAGADDAWLAALPAQVEVVERRTAGSSSSWTRPSRSTSCWRRPVGAGRCAASPTSRRSSPISSWRSWPRRPRRPQPRPLPGGVGRADDVRRSDRSGSSRVARSSSAAGAVASFLGPVHDRHRHRFVHHPGGPAPRRRGHGHRRPGARAGRPGGVARRRSRSLESVVVLTEVPDRTAGDAALADESIKALIIVPADLSGPRRGALPRAAGREHRAHRRRRGQPSSA